MSEIEEVAKKAVREPIRTPPPIGRVRAAVVRRRRRRRLVGAMASVVVVAVGVGGAAVVLTGSEDAERLGTAAATQIPDAPTGEGEVPPDPPPSPAPDQPLSADVAAATPARLLREAQTRLGDSVVIIWRLTESGSIDGRCLDLTAFVDGAVHSRGGSCSRSPNPTGGAPDLEPPLVFDIAGERFLALFGRVGPDAASVRITDPHPSTDADVDGAWLVVGPAPELPAEALLESFNAVGVTLLSERVAIEPTQASPLGVDGLVVELRVLGATVEAVVPEPSGFFAGTPSGLCVNDRQVRVYEYGTVADRESESSEITTDGQPNTLTFVSWVGPPRFFAAGRLIVLDLSGDGAVEDLLAAVMGPTLSRDAFGRPSEEPPCGENLGNDSSEGGGDGDTLPPPTQPELSPEAVEEAEALTASFIDALGRGDLASASDVWTSYPYDPAGPEPELIRVMDSYTWLCNEDLRLVVVPSFARLEAQPVVTVVSGDLATTFVLSLPVAGEPLRIERLPNTEDFDVPVSPSPGSMVNPGDTIVFGTMPLEGGSRAFLEDQELVVVVDHEALTTSVVLPEQLPAEFVLTLTGATPEQPVAFAFTYRSAEP